MKKLTTIGATLALWLGVGAAQAATFTVTSTADTDGAACGSPCTLRQAINAANASVGADTIGFAFSGTIVLASVLPTVTDTLTIDGTGRAVTLSGGGAVPVLQLDSAMALSLKSLTIANGRSASPFTAGGVTVLAPTTAPAIGGALNISRCTFAGNSTTGPWAAGAVLLNVDVSLTVDNSTFTGNSGQSTNGDPTAGGIHSFSTGAISIANSTFENNAGSVGAVLVFAQGTLEVSGSTFTGNSGTSAGGAIRVGSEGSKIVNSTFHGNSAVRVGGAIYFLGRRDFGIPAAQLAVTQSTFSGNTSNTANTAGQNGALFGGTFVLRNSVFEKSTNANCGTSGIVDGGGNLSDDASCALTAATSLANTPAQLGALQNNGGPTRTMAPLTGSPAIDLGVNQFVIDAGLATDQRGTGFARISPSGGTVDRGAIEVQVDNVAPTCTASATPNKLTESNHKLVRITTSVVATDDKPGVTFVLRAVTSSEADSGLGRSDVPLDIQGWVVGGADVTGQLRSERFSSAGRTYTITYEARDAAGNAGTCQALVKVSR